MNITCLHDIEDLLNEEAIQAICVSGSNDIAVNEIAAKFLNKHFFFHMKKAKAVSILKEWFVDDSTSDLLKLSLDELKAKLIWIAAWNVYEGGIINE